MATKNKSNELKITRLYDAPREIVWDAWTDPEQAAQWWGPRGFTITTHSKDLRVGGTWDYTMHGPDGVDWPNTTQYLEVEEHTKLVYDHGGHADRPPLFRVTVVFADVDGKTKMDMTMTLPTPEAAAQTRIFIKQAGGNATWDRLAEYLEKEATGKERFVINRSFDAPIATIFEMWTNPKHVVQWLPPAGLTMEFKRANITTGGNSFFVMSSDQGPALYAKAEYLEVTQPNRIVYTQQFCDKDENISRHPMAPLWPETMLVAVDLVAESPESTRVTVTTDTYGPTTPEELEMFAQARGGMTQGWTGSFDKLENIVERGAND